MFSKLLCSVVLVIGGSAAAQEPDVPLLVEAQEPGPRVVVANPELDLGRIVEGETATATFIIRNEGTQVLEIEGVRSSCGCTTVKLTDEQKRVPPGGEVEIVAKFDSTRRSGEQQKVVTVTTNDPKNRGVQLRFKAYVETLANLKPSGALRIGNVRRGTTIEQTLDITPGAGATTLVLKALRLNAEGLEYTEEPLVEEGRTGVRVRFRVGEEAPIGSISTSAKIDMDLGGREISKTVQIVGTVTGDLIHTPSEILMPKATVRGHRFRVVNVRSTTDEPFEILSAEAGPYIQTDVSQQSSGMSFNVSLTLKESAPDGPFGSFLDIHTSNVSQPVIRIPVLVNVAPAVAISPPAVLLRDEGAPDAKARKVRLARAQGTPWHVTSATCDQSYVSVEVLENPASNEAESSNRRYVRIWLNDSPPPGRHEAVVTISTDVEGAEQLQVPVTILGRPETPAAAQ
jgi:hypothetical protein